MLEDSRLRVFVALADQRSFTKTAELLHITQPAVSHNIAELEKYFGIRLFHRLKGEVVLTDAGVVFKEYADRLLSESRAAEMFFRRLPHTKVRVASSEEVFVFLTGNLLSDFITVHPEIEFVRVDGEEYDFSVSIEERHEKRGMFALGFHPSDQFAATVLWQRLDYLFASLL